MNSPTIPADFVRRAATLAIDAGIDIGGALDAARISRAVIANPHARLTPTQVTRLIQYVWTATDDELFGLTESPVVRGTFRVLCLSQIHCRDLDSALDRLVEVARVIPTIPRISRIDTDGITRIEVEVAGRDDAHTRIATDFLMLILHRFEAWLVGSRVRLTDVYLPYVEHDAVLAANYDAIFGVPVTFGAGRSGFDVDPAVLRAPVVRSEEDLEEYLRASPVLALTERDYGSTASAQVRRVFESGGRGRTATADDVADMLSVSPAHLRRLLRQEGTSLARIREDVLRDAAVAGLRRGEPVEEISTRLGFSEPSAFRRAFKRWTGQTPRAFR